MENSHQGNKLSNPTEWEKWTLNDDDYMQVYLHSTEMMGREEGRRFVTSRPARYAAASIVVSKQDWELFWLHCWLSKSTKT